MSHVDPVPFRLPVAGKDLIDLEGVHTTSYRVEGLLHLEDDYLVFQWGGTQHVEDVGLKGVVDEKEKLPNEELDVPVLWISEARLTGGWWAPRLRLRARRLEAFEPIPSARPGTVTLKIRNADRPLARAMIVAIEMALADARLAQTMDITKLDEDGVDRLRPGDA